MSNVKLHYNVSIDMKHRKMSGRVYQNVNCLFNTVGAGVNFCLCEFSDYFLERICSIHTLKDESRGHTSRKCK